MKALLSILALATTASLYAADDAAIINGPHYAFTIVAPQGWKLTSTKDLQVALHPAGTTFAKSTTVMYARPANKQQLGISTIPELNRLDLKGIQLQHPAATSRKVGTVTTARGTKIPLYSFSGGGFSELVAYADQAKTITVFVVSADTDEKLKAARPAFNALLSSYVALDPPATPQTKQQPAPTK